MKWAESLMQLENIGKAVLIIFSVSGFFKNTIDYLEKHGIAWTDDRQWIERC